MKERITVDSIEQIKERIYNLVSDSQRSLKNCHHIDVRIEVSESKFAMAQKGAPKESGEESRMSLGVRVIAGDVFRATGYFGSHLGSSDLRNIEEVIKKGIEHAWRRALANASWKAEMKRFLNSIGESIQSTILAAIEIHKDIVARLVLWIDSPSES